MALFDAGINKVRDLQRSMLAWINLKLVASHTDVNVAMQAPAAANVANFSSLGTFSAASGASPRSAASFQPGDPSYSWPDRRHGSW
jgi:hypothetical protein